MCGEARKRDKKVQSLTENETILQEDTVRSSLSVGARNKSTWEMDKFECMVQAHEYKQRTYGEQNLEEFQGQVKYIKSEEGKELLELLQQEREDHFQKRKHQTPVIFIIGIYNSLIGLWKMALIQFIYF